MKQTKLFILITVVLTAFTHCKKEDPKTLSVTPINKTVSKYAEIFTISIESNTDWTISSNETWCVVESSSGKDNKQITVDIDENSTTSQRTAIITIEGTGVNSVTVTVNQEATSKYITITSPDSSTNWQTESQQQITWEDNLDENVIIELYKGTNLIETISSSASSSGSYNWQVSSNLLTGNDYKIKISSVSDNEINSESDLFTITEKGNITITSPNSSISLDPESQLQIIWQDNIDENVIIELYKGTSQMFTISLSAASSGEYNWVIPENTVPGNDYKIKITSIADNTIYDESEYFQILNPIEFLFAATNNGVYKIDKQGNSTFFSYGNQVEIYNNNIYVTGNGWDIINKYDIDGTLLSVIPIPSNVTYFIDFTILDESGFAFHDNENNKVYFADVNGDFITEILMPNPSLYSLQNADGIRINDEIIVSDNGNNQIFSVDLNTYNTSIFKDLSQLSGWLGSLEFFNNKYYICQATKIYSFVENEEPVLICTLPEGNITGIVVYGSYAYVSINFENKVMKINLQDGTYEDFANDLSYPDDIENYK